MSSDENTMNSDAVQAEPGTQLRGARESKQMSLEDISKRTNISVSRLQALEENRFDILGPEPFVIGYIRKFAKILEIESDSLVEEYKRKSGIVDASRPPRNESAPLGVAGPGLAVIAGRNIAQTIRHISGWWIVGGLVAIWVVGVYVLIPGEQGNPMGRPPAAETGHVENADPVPYVDDSAPAAGRDNAMEDRNSNPGQSDGTFAAEPDSVPIPESVSPTVEADADQPGATQLPAAGDNQDGQDLLVMNFVDECWVEVNDANGKPLFAALQTPADTLQLFGQAPFTVKLGNARAVSLAINGRAVNTEPRPGRDTVRLTVAP